MKRSESRLRAVARESERARREQLILLNACGEGVFGVDRDGRCIFVNRVGAGLIGYSEDEVLGKSLEALLAAPGERESAVEGDLLGLGAARNSQACQIVETVLYRKDGTAFEAECLISPIAEPDEDLGSVVTLRNITQRKSVERGRLALLNVETALREKAQAAERRAKFLAEASELFASSLEMETTLNSLATLVVPEIADSCVIYLMEESGRIQRLDPVHVDPERQRVLAEQFKRYPPVLETLVPPVRHALAEGHSSLLTNVTEPQLKGVPGDRAHRSVVSAVGLRSLIAVPLRARGRVVGAITYGLSDSDRTYGPDDVTLADDLASRAALAIDNARLYQESRAAVRARNQVLGVVSHDLRNPLTAVRLSVQALLRHWPPPDDAEAERRQLVSINAAADRMHRLIHDLLDVVQIEAGNLAIDTAPLAVRGLFEEAVHTASPAAAEKSIELTVDAPADLPTVRADEGRVLQVLSNLIDNAIKFSPAGARVVVGASTNERKMVIFVRDRGCGIEENHVAHIFDRFWRVQDDSRGGAGLGLAIAKGIVESHGGTMWVETRPGSGSTFYFSLRLAPLGEPEQVGF